MHERDSNDHSYLFWLKLEKTLDTEIHRDTQRKRRDPENR